MFAFNEVCVWEQSCSHMWIQRSYSEGMNRGLVEWQERIMYLFFPLYSHRIVSQTMNALRWLQNIDISNLSFELLWILPNWGSMILLISVNLWQKLSACLSCVQVCCDVYNESIWQRAAVVTHINQEKHLLSCFILDDFCNRGKKTHYK